MHTIRLGPPWQCTASGTHARHARKFGRPRTLDDNEHVWLVCEHLPAAADIYLNGSLIGSTAGPGNFTADLTHLLHPRNEIVITLSVPDPVGTILLEIRS